MGIGEPASIEFLLREYFGEHGLDIPLEPINFSFEAEDNYHDLFDKQRKIMDEAYNRLTLSYEGEDLVDFTRALCAMAAVLVGTAVAFGIPFDKAFVECLSYNYDREKLREIIYVNTGT